MDPLTRLLGSWMGELNVFGIIVRIVLAIIFGAAIGWERSIKRHAAGLRTFILISLASAAAMIMDQLLSSGMFVLSAASVIGIAVISINSILYNSRSKIKGLTTSAGLWASGIVGLAIGAGLYTVSVLMFAALLLILSIFPKLESHLKNRSNHFEMHVEMTNPANLQDFVSIIRELGMRIDDLELNPAYAGSGLSVYMVAVTIHSDELRKYKTHKEIIEALSTMEYIRHIEEVN